MTISASLFWITICALIVVWLGSLIVAAVIEHAHKKS